MEFTGFEEAASALQGLGGSLQQAIQDGLESIGSDMVSEMQSICPVDTGFLQDNIGYIVNEDGLNVFSDAEYSGYVEFGTWKMDAQPFFTPVVDDYTNGGTIQAAMEEIIRQKIEEIIP